MSLDENNLESNIAYKHFNSIKENSEALQQLVNKYVKVQLIRDTEFHGFVHSIDPVKHSIILLMPNEESYTVNIIPGHAILNVVDSHPVPNYKPPEHILGTNITADDIIERKQKLITWFKKNLLPVTESGQKIIFGNVSILPPYGVLNICTDNPVVALQLRKIIENMPNDFEPDK